MDLYCIQYLYKNNSKKPYYLAESESSNAKKDKDCL
jgi:hypothetical protein